MHVEVMFKADASQMRSEEYGLDLTGTC